MARGNYPAASSIERLAEQPKEFTRQLRAILDGIGAQVNKNEMTLVDLTNNMFLKRLLNGNISSMMPAAVAPAPGAAGTPGSAWRAGNGVPANSLGRDGDFYLDIDTGDVYQKSFVTYALVANILGPAGADGAPGAITIIERSAVAITAPLDTVENILKTIAMPALGVNDRVRIRTQWTLSGAGNKFLRVKAGATASGTGGTAFLNTTQAANLSVYDEREIANRNATNSQLGKTAALVAFGGTTGAHVTTAIDTSIAWELNITAQKATGADAIVLESYSVERVT